MPKITIKGTVINFPDSGSSPNWSPAVIQAVEALADAVNTIAGTFDISPQVQNIDQNNSSVNITINNLSFPVVDVRSAVIYYTVHRVTQDSGPPDGQDVSEEGTLEILYNESNPITEKWSMVRSGQGDANISFSITDLGQVQFTTTSIGTGTHTGIISFRALAILNA